jgi:hypothetical protein
MGIQGKPAPPPSLYTRRYYLFASTSADDDENRQKFKTDLIINKFIIDHAPPG